ncbi:ubiquitin conjugating protein [Limnospira fusiformis CCALA 023]
MDLIFQRLLRINTFLLLISRKKLTRLWGLWYPHINRIQGVTVSVCQNRGYNPDYIVA